MARRLILDGFDNFFKRAIEAREAIARVFPYEPRVKPYYENPTLVSNRIEQIMGILIEAKSRYAPQK